MSLKLVKKMIIIFKLDKKVKISKKMIINILNRIKKVKNNKKM